MKYSMVKQFSNGAVDNIFKFFFKWVDFGKTLLESFWAFVEIWQAFLGIFYNLFLYVYYLILFLLDKGAEDANVPRLFRKPISGRLSSTPALDLRGSSYSVAAPVRTVSSAAASVASAASSAAETVSSVMAAPVKPISGKAAGKQSILKSIGEFFINIFSNIGRAVKKPAEAIAGFLANKVKPVKAEDAQNEKPGEKRSLIDEYMKEYEQARKA